MAIQLSKQLHFRVVNPPKDDTLPLVFLHGWGSNSEIWSLLLDELQCYAILVDLPGFGLNHAIPCDNAEQVIAALADVLPDTCVLVGWSLGGMLATQLAQRFPHKVKALVTIASNLRFCASADWTHACPDEVYQQFYSGFQRDPDATFARFRLLQAKGDIQRKQVTTALQSTGEAPAQSLRKDWQNALAILNELDNREVARLVTLPNLHIFGEKDSLVPVAVAEEVGTHFCGEAQVVRIDDAGHVPHISHASQVAAVIREITAICEPNPYQRDKLNIAKSFSRAAASYDRLARVQRTVADALLNMHGDYTGRIADLGCGTGYCMAQMASQNNHLLGVDIAPGMIEYASGHLYGRARIAWLCADMESLPIASSSHNGVVSSLSLQWCADLNRVFSEIERILVPGGWMLISTLLPGTLQELHEAWRQVDGFVHVNQFVEGEQILADAERAGFKIENAIRQSEILFFNDALAVMRSIKGIGAHNVNAGQNRGLTARRRLLAVQSAYEKFRTPEGLPATYRVMYIRARKAHG